ncbi:uncharacterized protein LOC111077783 [Drosophila obscura]|uniref:uncharacterized protein LOC111077783 n=1 Tax=Drosophila obscura TaxID=7282 RepID=UPI000B9FEB97|nr:uncharacterized protein LOC111077783 [Drosophila obscura]
MSRTRNWSRAKPHLPRDNLKTEAGIRATKFPAIIDPECGPVSMAMIISWEYARIWLRERDANVAQHEQAAKPKTVNNDFEWWLKLHKTNKRFCKIK